MREVSLWLARRLPGGQDAAVGMNKGGTFEADGIKVTMTHADHSAGAWNPGGETTLYLGDPVGLVVEVENGFRFYLAGGGVSGAGIRPGARRAATSPSRSARSHTTIRDAVRGTLGKTARGVAVS